MPELPEVETIRRQLEPALTGRTITGVDVVDETVVDKKKAADFRSRIGGRNITALERRGKYLLFMLGSDDALVIHLRMTGRVSHLPRGTNGPDRKHLRLVINFEDGSALALHDSRRFGRALFLNAADAGAYWERLGPEPLERSFTAAKLAAILANSRRPVKSLLMDQSKVAGIGNIYADEALFAAGIRPERRACDVSASEAQSLCREIKATLRLAIRKEGSSIDTYRGAYGAPGSFQDSFKVHRRQGEPCPRCGQAIEKTRIGGRGTYLCSACQK